MSRKKAENTEKKDFVIGLLERHSHVPTQEDQLARYTKMYLGRAVGFDKPVAEAAEPEPVMQPVEDAFSPIDAEVAAATAADDVYNDYGQPGATVAMDAIGEPVAGDAAEPADGESVTMTFDAAAVEESATMTFDAAEIENTASVEVEPDLESDTGTVMMDAIDDGEGDDEGEGETKDGDAREGENGRAKKKKRRHR